MGLGRKVTGEVTTERDGSRAKGEASVQRHGDRHWSITTCTVALFAFTTITGTGCTEKNKGFRDRPDERASFGELVYSIVEDNLESVDSCSEPMVDELQGHRVPVITSIDATLPADLLSQLRGFVQSSVLPAIDSGAIPETTDTIAKLIEQLIDEERDPEHETLQALLNLAQTRTVAERHHWLSLIEATVHDQGSVEVVQAIGELAQQWDGVDYAVNSALDLMSRELQIMANGHSCEGLSLGNLEESLLNTSASSDTPNLGTPAWMVYADLHGNPQVAQNPLSLTVYPPFVDANGDGAADVDHLGRPVDSTGSLINIAPIGDQGSRDSEGRALAQDGQLLYDYFDAKRTGLSMLLLLAQEALEDQMHRDFGQLVDTTIETIEICEDGSGTCRKYPTEDNPYADVAWTLVEIARFDDAANFLKAWSALIKDHPEVAERVMVALGQVVEALQESQLDLTDEAIAELMISVVPMLDDVFETDNASDQSTARLLLDVVHDLGQTGRDLPHQILDTIDFVTLSKDATCSDAPPNRAASMSVDYQRPRYYDDGNGLVDNRSSIEQSIELLSAVDCGSVPFTDGKSVAHFVIEQMAAQSEDTACGVIDLLLGTIDVFGFLGQFTTELSLNAIGCDGEDVFERLTALESLAQSGALNGYLPIAKVFVDHQQVGTLLDLFELVADDLHTDDDGDSSTQSTVRKALPFAASAIRSGTADAFFDLIDILVSVEAVEGQGPVANVIVDSLERMVDDDQALEGRLGTITQSSYALQLLEPYQTIVNRLNRAQATEPLERLLEHVMGYVTTTRVDDQGTAAPEDDVVRLENTRFIPLTTMVLDFLSDLLVLPEVSKECYFDQIQESINSFLDGRNFATLIRLLKSIEDAPSGYVIEDFAIRALNPINEPGTTDIYSPLVQLISAYLQASIASNDINALVGYLADVVDPSELRGRDLVETMTTILESDTNGVMIGALRNLTLSHGLAGAEPPLSQLMDAFSDVSSIDTGAMCMKRESMTLNEAVELVETLARFVRNDDSGLGSIYRLVGMRESSPN